MAGKTCERCGSGSPSQTSGSYALFDYCASCSRDLCDACMANGCCGHTPAMSGAEADGEYECEEVAD